MLLVRWCYLSEMLLGRDVTCQRCYLAEMLLVRDVTCQRCYLSDDVTCQRCYLLEMLLVRDVNCQRCYLSEMLLVRDVTCQMMYKWCNLDKMCAQIWQQRHQLKFLIISHELKTDEQFRILWASWWNCRVNFIVFGLTRPGLKPTIYRTRGEHANHYATDAVGSKLELCL